LDFLGARLAMPPSCGGLTFWGMLPVLEVRRVGRCRNGADMTSLPVSAGPGVYAIPQPVSEAEDGRRGLWGQSHVRLSGSHVGMSRRLSVIRWNPEAPMVLFRPTVRAPCLPSRQSASPFGTATGSMLSQAAGRAGAAFPVSGVDGWGRCRIWPGGLGRTRFCTSLASWATASWFLQTK